MASIVTCSSSVQSTSSRGFSAVLLRPAAELFTHAEWFSLRRETGALKDLCSSKTPVQTDESGIVVAELVELVV
jgi:hypothetical protein